MRQVATRFTFTAITQRATNLHILAGKLDGKDMIIYLTNLRARLAGNALKAPGGQAGFSIAMGHILVEFAPLVT